MVRVHELHLPLFLLTFLRGGAERIRLHAVKQSRAGRQSCLHAFSVPSLPGKRKGLACRGKGPWPAVPAPDGGRDPSGTAPQSSGTGHAGLSEGTAPFVRQQAAKSCVETRKSAPARLWDVKRRFTEGRLRGAWRLLKGVRHARRYRGGASPPWAMVMKSLTRFTRLASLEPAS